MNTPTPAGVLLSAPEQGLAKERRVILQADRVMRVYIAGPMTGLPEFNFPAFNAMAEVLRADGWHVENPAEHGHVDGAEWADYLRYDISRLSTCSAMMLLPGWSSSRGARLEVSIAKELGHEMLYAVGAEQMPSDFDRVTAERDAALTELASANKKINKAWNRTSEIDRKGFIPGAMDAWKRPVPQHLPYDFSGSQGASATQYCNGWNDCGGYWSSHVSELQQRLTAADERADVLEGFLNLAQGHIGDASLSRDIDAALKPAEGGGDDA